MLAARKVKGRRINNSSGEVRSNAGQIDRIRLRILRVAYGKRSVKLPLKIQTMTSSRQLDLPSSQRLLFGDHFPSFFEDSPELRLLGASR